MSEQAETPDTYVLPNGEQIHRDDLVDRLVAAVATTTAVAIANSRQVAYLERENAEATRLLRAWAEDAGSFDRDVDLSPYEADTIGWLRRAGGDGGR